MNLAKNLRKYFRRRFRVKAGDKKDILYINKASDVLAEISHKEREAMSILLEVCQEMVLQQV